MSPFVDAGGYALIFGAGFLVTGYSWLALVGGVLCASAVIRGVYGHFRAR